MQERCPIPFSERFNRKTEHVEGCNYIQFIIFCFRCIQREVHMYHRTT